MTTTIPSREPRGRPVTVAMQAVVTLLAFGSATVAMTAAQPVPTNLAALAAKAKLVGPVTAWCRAEFREGSPGAFAVAVAASTGGRYIALEADGRATTLGSFKRSADLSCYSSDQARKLDAALEQSDTMHGQIAPRWNTTVVCGFIDDATAQCWQYSPADRSFVRVGQWIT